MEKWIYDWHKRYSKLKKSLEKNSHSFNNKLYEQLAAECGALLDTWMDMEDKLDDIKEMKQLNQTNKAVSEEVDKLPQTQLEGPIYFHLDIFDKAIETLKIEIGKEPKNDIILYLYLGFSYLYEGMIDKGKETFLFVLHSTFNKLEKHFAYVGLGCLYGRTHQYEEAIHYFEKANMLYNNSDLPYNIGMAFVMLKKYELALPYLEKSIKENEEDGEARYFLGFCYLKMGNESRAFEEWYSALQILEYKDLLVTIAYEFETHGYYTAAIHCYKRLEVLGFQDSWVYHGIAWNTGLLDQKEAAILMFEKLLSKSETDINIWISYLWLLSKWEENTRIEAISKRISKNNIKHPLIDKILS